MKKESVSAFRIFERDRAIQKANACRAASLLHQSFLFERDRAIQNVHICRAASLSHNIRLFERDSAQ